MRLKGWTRCFSSKTLGRRPSEHWGMGDRGEEQGLMQSLRSFDESLFCILGCCYHALVKGRSSFNHRILRKTSSASMRQKEMAILSNSFSRSGVPWHAAKNRWKIMPQVLERGLYTKHKYDPKAFRTLFPRCAGSVGWVVEARRSRLFQPPRSRRPAAHKASALV